VRRLCLAGRDLKQNKEQSGEDETKTGHGKGLLRWN
jgi:hypothetical protein